MFFFILMSKMRFYSKLYFDPGKCSADIKNTNVSVLNASDSMGIL